MDPQAQADRFTLRTMEPNIQGEGPLTVLCELAGFCHGPPTGHFAIGLRSAAGSIYLVAELRPIFKGNQVYVTIDKKPGCFGVERIQAGTNIGSCVVVTCPALYPLYLDPWPAVELIALSSVTVPPGQREAVKFKMTNGRELLDSFPLLDVDRNEQNFSADVYLRRQSMLFWLDKKARTEAGVEVLLRNSTVEAIQVEKGAKMMGHCCMYKTSTLTKQQFCKSLHHKAQDQNFPKNMCTCVERKEDMDINLARASGPLEKASVIVLSNHNSIVLGCDAFPATAMYVPPAGSTKVLFELAGELLVAKQMEQYTVQVQYDQQLNSSLCVEQQACNKVGKFAAVKVRNLNDEQNIAVTRDLRLKVSVVSVAKGQLLHATSASQISGQGSKTFMLGLRVLRQVKYATLEPPEIL